MKNDIAAIKKRILKEKIFKYTVILISVLTLLPLFFILYYLFVKGISSINWNFLTKLPAPPGEKGGGVVNAIMGTGELILIASLFAVPIGIFLGVFVAENRRSKLARSVSFLVELLQGIPSIVIGILAYAWVVIPMGGFSALSGGVALAIMMLPIISKYTEETFKLIPHNLKEASFALGVPYYKTILFVIIPSAISGITAGIIIAVSRIAGETAPLLFTAFGNPFINLNPMKPVSSLPLLIFNYAGSPYEEWHNHAWGASFLLVVFVLLLNLIAKGVIKKWEIRF